MVSGENPGRPFVSGVPCNKALHRFYVDIMWEGIIGLLASVAGIVAWWVKNRAKTKEEVRRENAAKVHKDTADVIDSQLGD